MLEDELTSILADGDIKQLIIVDSAEQQELARKLRLQNRPFLISDFDKAAALAVKSRQRTNAGGHSTQRRGLFKQLLSRRSVDDLTVVVNLSLIHISEPTRLLS